MGLLVLGESIACRFLRDISDQLGLREVVTEVTRCKSILDLVLVDVSPCVAMPCAAVADEK